MVRKVSNTSDKSAEIARLRRFRPILETLESRLLMTASPSNPSLLSHSSGICGCPICTGKGLENIPLAQAPSTGTLAATNALSSIPQLNSLLGASATLFLDFDGSVTGQWGSYSNVSTRVYDQDGDASTFSNSELNSIREIWQRVAEDYAPFKINVTTVDPGNATDRVTARIAIGGSYQDWFGSSAGGVAYLGGFYNGAPNVGFVFEDNLGNGNARYTAEAASHEAGHLFGLNHQSNWVNGSKTEEYHTGANGWAPVMGVGYYQTVTTWHNGATPNSATSFQDDMSIISNTLNGFGYRNDDFGNSSNLAHAITNGTFSFGGVIAQNTDSDWFSFTTSGGSVSLNLAGIGVGQNLDGVLEIQNASGTTVYTANGASLNESISTTLGSGTYFVSVRSTGAYGRVGQYTFSGSFTPGANVSGGGGGNVNTTAPEIAISVDGVNVASGTQVNFGSIASGGEAIRTFTIRNLGTSNLNVTNIGNSLPAGFTLVSNVSANTIAAGGTASFTVRFSGTSAGNYGGNMYVLSNDADEATFTINVAGGVAASGPRIIDNGDAGFSLRGGWSNVTGRGRDGDAAMAAKGRGTSVATYAFSGLEAGTYRVSVTYVAARNLATNSTFSMGNGVSMLGTVRLNQEVAPRTFTANGSKWQDIGRVTLSNGQLFVSLNNNANDYVMADAVRVERISAAPTVRGGTFRGMIGRGATLEEAGNSGDSGAEVALGGQSQTRTTSGSSVTQTGSVGGAGASRTTLSAYDRALFNQLRSTSSFGSAVRSATALAASNTSGSSSIASLEAALDREFERLNDLLEEALA